MPLSTSSKIRVGTDEVPASTSFSASMKRDSSPPEAILRQRAERRAGVGGDLEMHALGAVLAPIGLGERGQHGAEPRLVEPQRRQLGGDRGIEAAGGPLARRRDGLSGGDIAGARRRRFLFEHGDALGPAFERGQPLRHRYAQDRQIGDRHRMLAGQRAQREQPLLDFFERARVEFESAPGGGQRGQRLVGLLGGALGRRDGAVEQPLGPVAGAFEPAQGARQRPLRPGLALDLADRLADRLAEPLGVLQQRAARAEPFLLVALRRQRLDLGVVVPQQILLGAAFGQEARRLVGALARCPPFAPGSGERVGADRVFREGVEQGAMRRRVQETALLALALDLDERVAEFAQQPDAGRLVVDKGAAAAVGAKPAGAARSCRRGRCRPRPRAGSSGPDDCRRRRTRR